MEEIEAALMQNKEAFESRKLTQTERYYPIYNKEMVTIMHALARFKLYLVCVKFNVKTDHNSLRFFMNRKDLNDHQ